MNQKEPDQACSPNACPASGGGAKPGRALGDFLEREAVARRMRDVGHKILVISGKGGVGKSTVAVNLAVSLALAGKRVGLLDIDIHGPSVPRLLGLQGRAVEATGKAILPVQYAANLKVMSIGFLLEGADEAVIWRGPMKFAAIKQFLKDVEWGQLDYLVVDSPPGTGDEPLSIAQLIPEATGAVVVTTPQEIAIADVRRCIGFCRQLKICVLGVIENMSGMTCPKCGTMVELFKTGGGRRMAREMGVPFLGAVPIDPQIVEASDAGRPYVQYFRGTPTARAFEEAIAPILALDRRAEAPDGSTAPRESAGVGAEKVRIAIALADGRLCAHLGQCRQFAVIEADRSERKVLAEELLTAPENQPGLLPRWLRERGVEVVIAGQMGRRAQALFEQEGIAVCTGSPGDEPQKVIESYLAGGLPPRNTI